MKKMLLFLLLTAFLNISCSVYQSLVNIGRLKFKLGTVNGFNINGVQISNKARLSDFTPQEILTISSAIAGGKLPVSFILNVETTNPNDGTGGYSRTNATIKSFPWRLLIDDKETISGNIASPFTVPGTGESVYLPLQINFDLLSFIKDRNYQSIINLALAIGGQQGSSANLAIYSRPTVSTGLGDIGYPDEIKIISLKYSN